MPRTEEIEPSSRRSRSRRSRNRHRSHGHQHVHHRTSRSRFRIKQSEKNFPAAVCSMISIVVLCTALAEPKWINLNGGGCMINNEPLHHLGTYQFFYPGKFLAQEKDFSDGTIKHVLYQFGTNINDQMDNCVTYKAALLLKTIIAFCFLAILCSLGAFILDLTAPKNRASKLLRRNAILSIVTVILTVVINMFCYWLTTEVEKLQKDTKLHHGSKVVVDFDISFYLITAAGGLGVIGTAFNCLRRYPLYEFSQGESLLDDYDGMEPLAPPLGPPPLGPDMSQVSNNLPPPPAYTP